MSYSKSIKRSLDNEDLGHYIASQLNHLFPDQNLSSYKASGSVTPKILTQAVHAAEERVMACFGGIRKKYFSDDESIHFDHLMSDQYCMYLYMLANHLSQNGGDPGLCTRLYYLNKVLHGVDIYFTTTLPEVFLFVHPTGSVLGPASYADFLVVYQGCTVGCLNEAKFPRFKGKTILYANATVLGPCTIGDNVCIAAGSSVVDQDIPDNKVVIGQGDSLTLRENQKAFFERPPFYYADRGY